MPPTVDASPGPSATLPHRGRTARPGLTALAATLFAVWVMISAFHPFHPTLPQAGLDASWVATMGEATDRGWRWGVDVTFTYGPAASLVTGYLNAAYLTLTLPLLLLTCLCFGSALVLLAGAGAPSGRGGAAIVGAAVTVGLLATAARGYDSLFLVSPLLPFLLALRPGRFGAVALAVTAGGAAAVGVLGLAKMSFALAALPLFVLGDAAALWRGRPPVLTGSGALGFVAADLAYGQRLADLPAFVRGQGEVVAGYSEAMALDGSRAELIGFVLAAAGLLAVSAVSEWSARPRGAGSRFAVPVGLALVLLILFKAGFVRQDGHTLIAWYGLALAAAVLSWARLRRTLPRAALLAVAVLGGTALGPWLAASRALPSARLAAAASAERDLFVTDPGTELAAAWSLAWDPAGTVAGWRDAKDQAWRDIAAATPLPRLDGGVDVLPSWQSRLLVPGLDYRPRPSFQEYSTYTPGLAAANRAFLSGPGAPAWVLFGPEPGFGALTLDRRYPNLAEGALWPDLLAGYRPERRIGELVALHRRAAPVPLTFGPLRRVAADFGEAVPVEPPPRGGGKAGAVVLGVVVRPTLLGRLAALLFRPAPLFVTVGFADGHRMPYRFVSGIGAGGFVVSPLVTNATEFEMLAEGAVPPPGRIVTSFSLDVAPRFWSFYAPSVAIEMRTVAVEAAPAPAAPASAWAALALAAGADADAVDIPAVPPARASLPVAGLSRVTLGYGLTLDPDVPPGPEKICFAVHPADNGGTMLWRRCLDAGHQADRDRQTLSLDLQPGTSELSLETACDAGCDGGVGAWWGAP